MKRVSIVFEETDEIGCTDKGGPGPRFNIFLEGVDTARLAAIPEERWSPAEFWGVKCFNIVIGAVQQAGAVESVKRKPGV